MFYIAKRKTMFTLRHTAKGHIRNLGGRRQDSINKASAIVERIARNGLPTGLKTFPIDGE